MKKIVLSAVYIVLSALIYAQSTSFESICRLLAVHPNMKGDFIQTKTIKAVNRDLKSSGNFIFSLDGIVWKTIKPFPSTMIVGLKSVVQIMPDGAKNVIDASSNQVFTGISGTLFAMFAGNAANLKNSYDINFTSSGNTWKVILSPKDKTTSLILKSISVSGEADGSFAEISKIILTEASEDSVTYEFTARTYPKELTKDEKAYFNER